MELSLVPVSSPVSHTATICPFPFKPMSSCTLFTFIIPAATSLKRAGSEFSSSQQIPSIAASSFILSEDTEILRIVSELPSIVPPIDVISSVISSLFDDSKRTTNK